MYKFSITSLIIVVATLSTAAQNNILFTIDNNYKVYTTDFVDHCSQYVSMIPNSDTAMFSDLLNGYINFRLQAYEAQKKHLDKTEYFDQAVKHIKETELAKHVASSAKAKAYKAEIEKRAVKQYHVSHIMIDIFANSGSDTTVAYKKICNARNRIANGTNFARVARETSDDPSACHNGGDIGFVSALETPGYQFESQMINAELNVLSQPFRNDDAYHIIKVENSFAAIDSINISPIIVAKQKRKILNDSIKELVGQIYQQLQQGGNFNALQNKYSSLTLENSTFSIAEAEEYFGTEIFSVTKGNFSKPIEQSDRWIIAKVNYTVARNMEKHKKNLENMFYGDTRYKICYNEFLDSIKKVCNYKKIGTYEPMYKLFKDSSIYNGTWTNNDFMWLSDNLFELNGQTYKVSDFANYVSENQHRENATKISIYLKNKYQEFVDSKVYQEAINILLKQSYFNSCVEKAKQEILCQLFKKDQKLYQKSNDKNNIEQYYNQNGRKFLGHHQLYLRILSLKNTDNRKKAYKLLSTYTNSKNETIDTKVFNIIESGVFKYGQNQIANQIILGFDNGTYSLPNDKIIDLEQENCYVLVWLEEKPTTKPIETIYNQIAAEYLTELEHNTIEQLRKKYTININYNEYELAKSRLSTK